MVITRVQIFSIFINKLRPIHFENRPVRFYVCYDKSVFSIPSHIHELFVLLANFERTVNDVLRHANFRKIAIFTLSNRYGKNNAYP